MKINPENHVLGLLALTTVVGVLSITGRHNREAPNKQALIQEEKRQDPCLNDSVSIIDYISLPLPIRIKKSSSIFTGTIISISPTQWNQDSGEYWEDTSPDGTTRYVALPYFTLEISSPTHLSGKSPTGNKFFVTVTGKSPAECGQELASPLRIGSNVILFTRETEIAWRHEQEKQILGLIDEPAQSILIQGSDGLFHESYQSDVPEHTGISLEYLKQNIAEINSSIKEYLSAEGRGA